MASTSLLLPLSSIFSTNLSKNHHQTIGRTQIRSGFTRKCVSVFRVQANSIGTTEEAEGYNITKRRDLLMGLGFCMVSSFLVGSTYAEAAGLPPEEKPKLCDATCEKELENVPMVTTESGLQYKDIKVGAGPSPPVGFQVAANYVAMVPSGQIFDSSLEKGRPYIFRVGADQVVKGLDEGILSMKVGGKRRLYVPGSLSFPKGLISAPGRPRVPPNSPVIFDVSLEFIPGLDSDEE
ncbi:LOW QUALITY PROTEIN: peptidyl-prolyl cis-trans isomerase FKBP16-3, chloroplastic [Lycium ferocissimum]|uniref:LOW QUALITY PROTEIN: peptidyl-prolyl cis-trans isomerase FKBP16-3, chloroplastic n=1 Tax=Lycium ferocissimum TaxID=112874 RepID=UPI002815C5D2|nr:LOW QUALITY PROTEIN: peptidyl-prolyl cis-trans isomerase FKBP16-3, chloroplastic [Lycium ferocissimum]